MNVGRKRKLVNRAVARSAVLMNLFVTPGMGSLMAGRFFAGLGQLAVAVAGFGLFLVWFVKVMAQSYRMFTGEESTIQMHAWLGFSGLLVFGLAWLWALATSVSLMNEARRNESTGLNLSGQPQSDTGSN